MERSNRKLLDSKKRLLHQVTRTNNILEALLNTFLNTSQPHSNFGAKAFCKNWKPKLISAKDVNQPNLLISQKLYYITSMAILAQKFKFGWHMMRKV